MSTTNLEIEHKYLLTEIPLELRIEDSLVIAQGWLPGETIVERIRQTVHNDGRITHKRAVKLGSGLVRQEFEETMTPDLFNAMWPFTESRRVFKRRYRIPHGSLTWELDWIFRRNNKDIFIAEVEVQSENDSFVIPDWLQKVLIREVTTEPAFTNRALAQ